MDVTKSAAVLPVRLSRGRRLLRKGLWWVGLPYMCVLILFAGCQRSIIYLPTRVAEMVAANYGYPPGQVEDLQITMRDGVTLHGWHVRANGGQTLPANEGAGELTAERPVVLFCSGNGGHRGYRTSEFQLLTGLGLDLYSFDYRGYGENAGSPSEEAIAEDMRVLWEHLTQKRHIAANRIFLYGESLGGGVATRLAYDLCQRQEPPAGLIVRSTFSSLADVGCCHYPWLPVRLLLVDRFPSSERIQQVRCPILVLHGQRDRIVPYSLGRQLFDAAPERSTHGVPKQMIDLPRADHNDVVFAERELVAKSVHDFVQRVQAQ